jgi:hypothetical protein
LRQRTPELSAALRTGIANPEPPIGSFLTASNFTDIARRADRRSEADLHEVRLNLLFNHPSGFFARAEANWYQQDNNDLTTNAVSRAPDGIHVLNPHYTVENRGLPGDDFWQFNVLAGYRFHRNQCELSCGVLNLSDTDYHLNPLNPYFELPRSRTLIVRCKLTF